MQRMYHVHFSLGFMREISTSVLMSAYVSGDAINEYHRVHIAPNTPVMSRSRNSNPGMRHLAEAGKSNESASVCREGLRSFGLSGAGEIASERGCIAPS